MSTGFCFENFDEQIRRNKVIFRLNTGGKLCPKVGIIYPECFSYYFTWYRPKYHLVTVDLTSVLPLPHVNRKRARTYVGQYVPHTLGKQRRNLPVDESKGQGKTTGTVAWLQCSVSYPLRQDFMS